VVDVHAFFEKIGLSAAGISAERVGRRTLIALLSEPNAQVRDENLTAPVPDGFGMSRQCRMACLMCRSRA
jgi:hypothetical protein